MRWPTLADLSRLPPPGLDAPASIAFSPDGTALTYLHGPGTSVTSLWWHDIAGGERVPLVSPDPADLDEANLTVEQQLDRERRRTMAVGVTEYAWLPDAGRPTLLVPLQGRALLVTQHDAGFDVDPVPGVEDASAVLGAPDGRHAAFVRAGDVWIVPLPGGTARQVTNDAAPGIFSGLAEYVAAEDLGRFTGMWWDVDGRHLAFARDDERAVPVFRIEHTTAGGPRHEEHHYPFAGGPNALVTLHVAAVDGGTPVAARLPMEDGDYLARVVAHPLGGWLVAVLPREQRSLHWLRVGSDASVRELWVEESTPWLNLDADTRVLGDGRILRTTERTGFRHLELRDPDGGWLGALTEGGWMVTGVVHADPERGEVLFLGTRHGPTERHLYRARLTPARRIDEPERLTDEAGWHDVVASHDGAWLADTWSDLTTAPRLVLRDRGGRHPRLLSPPSATARALEVDPPELVELVAADGATPLWAAIYRPPPSSRSDAPPPCVVWVYGGPHAQSVSRAWEVTAHPLRQYLARAGAAVVAVDNRGSAFRGLAFEAHLDRRLGAPEVADQAAAVRQLAERGEIDIRRVGITGGSYGGFMTLRAMALEPDLFRVGVAVAPVASWEGYDTAYTERYLGLPGEGDADDPYEAASALALAPGIQGSLLLIHGAIDENVHLGHSERLLEVMRAAGCEVDLVVLPEDRHRTRTPSGLDTRGRRTAGHLLAGLGLPLPAGLIPEPEAGERQAAGS